MTRTFEDKPAVRERVPLLVGLVGPSGSGKTYSGLRLATGIQRVVGGDIGVVDTEARRALHYADNFKFRHLEFKAPFGSLDYLEAVRHFTDKGVRTVLVDSMSHEHEGPGGYLDTHEREVERLIQSWSKPGRPATRDTVNFSAWQRPASDRRKLLNSLLQIPANFIFCFRAKEKLKIVQGEKPKPLGWMPIAGEEFVFEMTLNCLLYPASGGVPAWHPEELGEKAMAKLPAQFRGLFADSKPLSEETGEALARWAEGGAGVPASERDGLLGEIKAALSNAHPGSSEAAKKARGEASAVAFGVRGWEAVTELDADKLRAGLLSLQRPAAGQRTLDEQLAEEAAQREADEAAEFERQQAAG